MPKLPLRKLLFAAIPVAAALSLAEIALYLFAPSPTPSRLRASTLEFQPALFARHVLAQKAKVVDQQGAEALHCRINSQGYRGPEFAPRQPGGPARIVFYGGSAVFDIYAAGDEDWPHLVGEELRGRGMPAETINAGIPGHASFDCLGRFYAEGHRLRPDIAVLSGAWNDIKLFGDSTALLRKLKPFDGLDPRVGYWNWADRALCLSQLYLRARGLWIRAKMKLSAEGMLSAEAPRDALDPRALDQYRLTMALFCDLAREAGAQPVLMTEARLVSPANTPGQRKRIRYGFVNLTPAALERAYAASDSITREVAARKGAWLWDASRALTGIDSLYADHVHLRPQGSRALARLVADHLLNTRLAAGGD